MPPKPTDPRAPDRAAVLRTWIALERFDTRTLDPPDRGAGRNRRTFSVDVGPGEPLAWEPGHVAFGVPAVSDKVEWRHTLHLGQYDIGSAYERVESQFPDAEASRERRTPTRKPAPLLALALTTDGRPIMDSLQVSSAAWSIARTLRLGVDDPTWLSGFTDALSEVRGAFERIVIDAGTPGGPAAPDATEGGGSEAADRVPTELRVVKHDADHVDAASDAAASAAEEDHDPDPDDVIDEDGIGTFPLTWEHLLRLLGAAQSILKLGDHLTVRPIARTTSWQESKRMPLGSGDTLLNSFAVDDLERVAARVHHKAPGDALARYLDATHVAEQEAAARIDVDDDLGAVRAQTEPSAIPSGRWPADATHDLALGQQLAVNIATGSDAPSLIAVNGPPGTGKTTMLRDLIAGLVTQRAEVIASFSSPSEIFGKEVVSVHGERTIRVHKVSPRIAGREILLACATNAAAQNVSLELPALAAIDEEWRSGEGYLADFGTAALRAGAVADARAAGIRPRDFGAQRPSATAQDRLDAEGFNAAPDARIGGPDATDAWAMIAARLGRRSYCKDFASTIWWGPDHRPGGPRIAPTERSELGLRRLLGASQNAAGREAWAASRDRFNAAHAVVEALRQERQAVSDALHPSSNLDEALAQAVTELAEYEAHRDAVDAERAEAAADAAAAVVRHGDRKRILAEFGDAPAAHLVARLTSAGRTRESERKDAEQNANAARETAKRRLDEVRVLDRRLEHATADAESAARVVDDIRERLEARAVAAETAADPAAAAYLVPGPAWELDRDARDLRAPWSDERWNRARTNCFLAALDLHEATLLASGRDASRNLSIAMDLLAGRIAGLTHEVVLAAWQTLFLLVPVVSTTFASLPTMLTGLEQEDLGWLLIDEAGQAQPQQAAGAIWRSKRAVIVGDPLQLEPVSALPSSLADAIRKRYGVARDYVSPEASVQRLADAVMPWGGHRGDEHLWVGVPLNVHRRCETPIFDLVNAIAYDGRMVNATVPRAAHPALRVESCWLDVPSGGASDGHWIADEGVRLDALLAHLWRGQYDFRQVFAVSPFRDVARHLFRRANDPGHAGMTGGTIHTIQGREADTVILVLGGSPTNPGARSWASARPNLLNVAASRARQRFYVIGDYDAWIGEPYFRELRGLRRVEQPRVRVG
jgi:hypothetical protein